MCRDENNDKNKKNLPPSYSFFNGLKTAKPMTLKFSDFQFVSINPFVPNAPFLYPLKT